MSKSRIIKIQKKNGKTEFHLRKKYKIAIYEGGGAKGQAYPGAMRALAKKNLLDDITCFAGSSAGAITAAICSLGYQGDKLEEVVDGIDARFLLDRPIPDSGHFREIYAAFSRIGGHTKKRGDAEGEYYLNTGNNLLMTARKVIRTRFEECYEKADDAIKTKMEKAGILHHMNINRITFSDLEYMKVLFPEYHFADLVTTGTQLSGHSGFIPGQGYFDVINSPNMEIAKSIRISTSIPYVYKREEYLGDKYTDGGVTYNLPLAYFMDNKNYIGDIIALEFHHEEKKDDEVRVDPRKKIADALSDGKVNCHDAAKHGDDARKTRKKANKKRGVDIFSIDQGKLDTMDFGAKKEVIKEARKLTRKKIKKELTSNNVNINKDDDEYEEYNEIQLNDFLKDLKINSGKKAFYIDGKEIKSKKHKANLLIEMQDILEKEISIKNNPDHEKIQLERAYETLKNARVGHKSKQQQLTDDIKNNKFAWLYEKIGILIEKTGSNNQFLEKWLIDLKNHASPMDIVLSRGIVLVDVAILNSKNENSRHKKEIEKFREQFDETKKIINKLSGKIAKQYGFVNVAQLRDAMGEIANENHLEEHRKYFEKYPPKNLRDILSSPYVINDILTMNRIDDLNFIEYRSGTIRSQLVTKLKDEIKKGDVRWLTDLLVCTKLYKHHESNKAALVIDQYSTYITDSYATQYGELPTSDDDWKKHYSAVVKLFTNPKLTDSDGSAGDYSGHIDTILSDFADEVTSYLHGLQHDIELDVADVPEFIMDPSVDVHGYAQTLINQRIEFIKDNPKGQEITSSFRKIHLDDFDSRIYTEHASRITTDRKDQLIALCTYINTNPYTWYNDIFGLNSFFEFRENPLITLISNSKVSRELAIGFVTRLEELHDNQLYETRSDLNQQLTNRKLAEEVISEGISKIYEEIESTHVDTSDHDNKQGIATIEYSHDELVNKGWDQYFPDYLQNGLTIHLFRNDDAKKMPPIQQMVEGKIYALCKGAKKFSVNTDQIKDLITNKFHDEFDALSQDEVNNKKLAELLEKYTALTLITVFNSRTDKELLRDNFFYKVINEAKLHRVSNRDILNFDILENKFSYEHFAPQTTSAHDRIVGNQVANLGISFDGSYNIAGGNFKVSSSVVHHASLSPLETNDISELEILIDTCNHIEEIAITLGKLQLFGQEEKSRAVDVNWCYQLLTTNIGNQHDERESYLRISKAIGLMNDYNTMYGNSNIHLNVSMINAGVNKKDHRDEYFTGKGRQNRKAYLHLTDALRNLRMPDSLAENKRVSTLRNFVAHAIPSDDTYSNLRIEIKANADKFNNLRKIYNAIYDKDMLNSGQNISALINKYNVTNINELSEKINDTIGRDADRKKLNNKIEKCIAISQNLNEELDKRIKIMNDDMAQYWERSTKQFNVADFLTAIRNDISIIDPANIDEEKVFYVSALMFKTYMDELYYTGEYFKPEKAALFNAYTSAYQRLTGMMSTVGCEGGNDRTYVVRLALAAITGTNIEELPLPPDYLKKEFLNEYDVLKNTFAKIAMSNAALYTAITDTTAVPNVDVEKFVFLAKSGGDNSILNSLKIAEKHALHKLKASKFNMTKEIKAQADLILEEAQNKKAAENTVDEQPQTTVTPPESTSISNTATDSDSDTQENAFKKSAYEDRELWLDRLLNRIILISKDATINTPENVNLFFEKEKNGDYDLLNKDPEIYPNLRNIFNTWINNNPAREAIISLGRDANSFLTSWGAGLGKDFIDLAQAFSRMKDHATEYKDIDIDVLGQELNKIDSIRNYEKKLEATDFYKKENKTSLLYKALNDKTKINDHWLRDDEIEKYIKSSFTADDNVYWSPSNETRLNDILKQQNADFKLHIILNNSDGKTSSNTGSHWTAMKIEKNGDSINVEYVDSAKQQLPVVVNKILTEYCVINNCNLEIIESCPRKQDGNYECGYLSIYQISKWLNKSIADFDISNYRNSMKSLRNSIQKTILEATFCSASKRGIHTKVFEPSGKNKQYKLKSDFINSLFSKQVNRAESKARIHSGIAQELINKPAVILPDAVIEPPSFAPASDLTAYKQIQEERDYLKLVMDRLQNPEIMDTAILNKEVGSTVKINNLTEMDNELNESGTNTSSSLDLARTGVDQLKNQWNILTDGFTWKSTDRDRVILEAVMWDSEKINSIIILDEKTNKIIGKEDQATKASDKIFEEMNEIQNQIRPLTRKEKTVEGLTDDEKRLLTELSRTNNYLSDKYDLASQEVIDIPKRLHSSSRTVNEKLAPWISKHGFLEPFDKAKPGEFTLQEGFNHYLCSLLNNYDLHLSMITKHLELSKKIKQINTRIIPYEELKNIDIKASIGKGNGYLLVRKNSVFKPREWLLYHLDETGEVVTRKVHEHPGLSKLNEIINHDRLSNVLNKTQEIHQAITDYFYQQDYPKITEVMNTRKPIQKIHTSIHDHNKDAKKQAQHIWDTHISTRLKEGKSIALIYPANKIELDALLGSYNNLDQSIRDIFVDKNNHTALFSEIANLIQANHCRDEVHILPVPATLEDQQDYTEPLKNIANHTGAGFTILGLADNEGRLSNDDLINKELHELINKPVADWRPDLTEAYQKGPVGLSLFKNTALIEDMKRRIKTEPNSDILEKIRLVLDTKHENNEVLYICLVNVCKAYLASRNKKDDNLDLLVRSIAQYDKILKLWPDIETLDELIIGGQKFDCIYDELLLDDERLKKEQSNSERVMIHEIEQALKSGNNLEYQRLLDQVRNENPALSVQMKLDAHEELSSLIRNPADKRVTLSTILDPEGKYMNTLIHNHPYPLAGEKACIRGALEYKRGLIGYKDAASKVSMDKLRNKLVFMQPDTILNSVQDSHKENIAISDELNGILAALLNIQARYRRDGRSKHANEFIDLITNARTTINDVNKTEPEKTRLIIDNVRAAFDKTKTSDVKKSFVRLFYDANAYQYPRLLKEFLDTYKDSGTSYKNIGMVK